MHGPMRSNVAQGTYDEAQGTRRYKTLAKTSKHLAFGLCDSG